MDHTIAEEYKSSLNDLNFNSKPLINMLTMLAEENKKHAALIVTTIVNHINSASPESKLPGLYLVDSIIKNLGDQYLKIFCQREHIIDLFTSVFEKVDENTRSLMFKLRQTWTDIVPNKVLYNLDASVKKLDPAWPITARNPSQMKRILVNPKFLEEKKTTTEEVPTTVVTNADVPSKTDDDKKDERERDRIKLKQGEVLKQLLAKQEQLRQLEIKKLQLLTMRKKNATKIGSSSHIASTSSNSYKQNPIRDPRMVKINNTPPQQKERESNQQHSSVSAQIISHKAGTVSQGKPSASDIDTNSSPSVFPGVHTGISTKIPPQAQSGSSSKNSLCTSPPKNVSINENRTRESDSKREDSAVNNMRLTLKKKKDKEREREQENRKENDKCNSPPIHQEKESVKSNFSECASNSFKAKERKKNESKKDSKTVCSGKSSSSIKSPKTSKVSPKKREMCSLSASFSPHKKKLPLLKIPKKSDKLKSLPKNSDVLTSSSELEDRDKRKNQIVCVPVMHDQSIDKSASLAVLSIDNAKDSFQIEPVIENDLKSISQKDEDLRIALSVCVPLNDEPAIKERERVPKRDIAGVSDPSGNEMDENTNSRKKIRSEDDYRRPHSPTILFGSKDQDLRSLSQFDNIKSKDWTQYKATHPDEYTHKDGASDGRFKQERRHVTQREKFSDFKPYHRSNRYGSGRYVSRHTHNVRTRHSHFPRGARGRRGGFYRAQDDTLVILDSQNYLQQVEDRFRSGKLCESDYREIRHGLQKVLQQSMTGPSTAPAALKPFVLNGENKLINFVEDTAFILTDSNEPRELVFKPSEERKVFIKGVAEPLILGFDGKSVEFEVHGRRHIIRFGVPGREIYINNHPYEAEFGGPPISLMLEDGCVYSVCLSGPPPQVIIGNKPQCELLSKYPPHTHGENMDKTAFTVGPNYTNEEQVSQTEYSKPGAFLQDIDMRPPKIPENMTRSDSDALVSKDSSFFYTDMKDVDWRHMPPPPSNLEVEQNFPNVFDESVSHTHNMEKKHPVRETWYKEEDGNQMAFSEERNNQPSMVQESARYEYEWEPPSHNTAMSHRQPIVQAETMDTRGDSQENWYFNQDKSHWRNEEYNHLAQLPEKCPRYQGNNQFQKRDYVGAAYSRRPSYPNRRARGRVIGSERYVPPWSTNNRGSRHMYNELHPHKPTNFSPGPSKARALLPSPPFAPQYPATTHSSLLPPPVDTVAASVGVRDGSNSGFTPQPPQPAPFASEIRPMETNSSDLVDVESLLEKLIAAGIINSKQNEQPVAKNPESETVAVPETSDADAEKSSEPTPPEEIPEIHFTPESLRIHRAGVIAALHTGMQCAACGIRFKHSEDVIFSDRKNEYARHLDWHFRINSCLKKKEKDGAKKPISRRWHYEVEDWIEFEEFENFEERVPSYFELQADSQQNDAPEVPAVVSVPATSDDEEACPMCTEPFQLFWHQEDEEWHCRDAVRHDNVTYHPACYEDFKKAAEAEKMAEAEKAARSLENEEIFEVDEDVTDHLNFILDEVEKTDRERKEMEITKVDLNTSEPVEEVPSETQFEEELLEGKPGEEEIIGVIELSDMEVESDVPKTESKMVVMKSGGITLKVKAESLQCHSPSNSSEKVTKPDDDKAVDDDEIEFRPPPADPRFEVRPPVSRGRELSGLCCIM